MTKKPVLRDVIASSSSNSSGGGDIKGDPKSSSTMTPPSVFDVADLDRTTANGVQVTSQGESGRDRSVCLTVVIALVVVAVCGVIALVLFVLYRDLSSCRSSNDAKQPAANQGSRQLPIYLFIYNISRTHDAEITVEMI